MTMNTTDIVNEPKRIDLIIVGTGPAGISTALHLLKLDPSWSQRMILVEKSRHPRSKLCGGGLTSFGLKILQNLDIDLPLPISQARVEDIRLYYKKRIVHGIGYPMFIIYRREELDAYLVQEVRRRGVIIHEDEEVLNIKVNDDSVLVNTNKDCYLAKTVVGADGSKGIIRRKVVRGAGDSRVGRTLEVVIPSDKDAPPYREQYAFFNFDFVQSGLQGYAWIFPSIIEGKPYYNLGIYDSGFYRKKRKSSLPIIFEEFLSKSLNEHVTYQLEGHPIHWFHPTNRLSSSRIILVGDTAGADPLLGEGIAPGLGYGKIAAEVIEKAFRKDNFSYGEYKRKILFSQLGRYLLIRWYIAWWSYRLCHYNWFMQLLWTCCMVVAFINKKPKIEEKMKPHQSKEI
jgi:menaquinone-9 beta-reductase